MFHCFVAHPQNAARQEDHALVTGGRIHQYLQDQLASHLASIQYAKTWRGLKLPKRPRGIRAAYQSWLVRRLQPQVGVFWNRLGDLTLLGALRRCGARAVYYEHGAAWLSPPTEANRRFLQDVDAIICNSHAAQRVVELRWRCPGTMRVVQYGLRPDLVRGHSRPRSLPTDGPFRLGVAGRLIPLKGMGIVLHALKDMLRRSDRPVELWIAGVGPLASFLARETKALNLGDSVTFKGCVQDMGSFYQSIDLLVVPSVREPFGLVALEAAAHGCPTVGSRVDGIPEAVADGKTGVCLEPTLDLAAGLAFGGDASDFPSQVYDPEQDKLTEPRFLDPRHLADAVLALLNAPERYASLSAAALDRVREQFAFSRYASELRLALE